MITITNNGIKIDNALIADFEKKTGCILPNDYKQFMLQYNGGKCTPNYFEFTENNIKSDSAVRAFWAFGGIESSYDMDEGYSTYIIEQGERMPAAYIPIAEDDGGNLICISCEKSNYGEIFFWNHEEEDSDDLYGNLYFVANSFTDFINGLKEFNF